MAGLDAAGTKPSNPAGESLSNRPLKKINVATLDVVKATEMRKYIAVLARLNRSRGEQLEIKFDTFARTPGMVGKITAATTEPLAPARPREDVLLNADTVQQIRNALDADQSDRSAKDKKVVDKLESALAALQWELLKTSEVKKLKSTLGTVYGNNDFHNNLKWGKGGAQPTVPIFGKGITVVEPPKDGRRNGMTGVSVVAYPTADPDKVVFWKRGSTAPMYSEPVSISSQPREIRSPSSPPPTGDSYLD